MVARFIFYRFQNLYQLNLLPSYGQSDNLVGHGGLGKIILLLCHRLKDDINIQYEPRESP